MLVCEAQYAAPKGFVRPCAAFSYGFVASICGTLKSITWREILSMRKLVPDTMFKHENRPEVRVGYHQSTSVQSQRKLADGRDEGPAILYTVGLHGRAISSWEVDNEQDQLYSQPR